MLFRRISDIKFSTASKNALEEIAVNLIPHEKEILKSWIRFQFARWKPPGFTRKELETFFGIIVHNMLASMKSRNQEWFIEDIKIAGTELALRKFPYDALIISFHFLEESYMPFLLGSFTKKTVGLLIKMDEFMHAVLAVIASSYFYVYRKELLEEAEVGRIVQEGLLPQIPERIADLEVGSVYLSARERAKVGGDLVDLITLGHGKISFIIGDFSGHGIEAAVDSVMLRSLFRGFMHENPDLIRAMSRLNRVLLSELDSSQFATALAGVYDESGILQFINAGHPPPIYCDRTCRLLESGGTALAVDKKSTYTFAEIELKPGSLFVAYTDGLIEARNKSGFFGEERAAEVVKKMRDASPLAVAEKLLEEALRHSGGKLKDDAAILVLKRLNPSS
ncbi:MAG: serine/threonine-protein phosphatase [Firmicutes bacterium]|nr:serine/threonine-protein phosphatase [Bacillota bacterium]